MSECAFRSEAELYPRVKALLEAQGYEVKGEIGAADVVAVRGDEPPVIVELKLRFSLSLLQQGVARLAVTDAVYVCVPQVTGRGRKAFAENVRLCRRLGLGVMTVRARDGFVELHCDPGPYAPRKSEMRKRRLLREFARRVGDPNRGGATRAGLVTAYRQDALRIAGFLSENGASKGAVVARATGVGRATAMMRADHYGWFERVETGIYALTPKGAEGLATYGTVPDRAKESAPGC